MIVGRFRELALFREFIAEPKAGDRVINLRAQTFAKGFATGLKICLECPLREIPNEMLSFCFLPYRILLVCAHFDSIG